MARRIVFCSDGTWDNADNHTNVYRFYKALEVSATQIPFYDDGVGVDGNPLLKVLGGAFGEGLFDKIRHGYAKISHVYEKGDEIFLFGFSRGAYTARCLGGMIGACGLPTKNFDDDALDLAFSAYRDRDDRKKLLDQLNTKCEMDCAVINTIGVWDTVGSLGIPAAFGGVDPIRYGFLDTALNPKVKHAYHALAIDERREEFPATLWQPNPGADQVLEQVWFAGVHCDVGGSYPEDPNGTALSDITLAWMMHKAAGAGLEFDQGVMAQRSVPVSPQFALDTIHESWSPQWFLPKLRNIVAGSAISNSVILRCQHDSNYRPRNLNFVGDALAQGYSMIEIVGGGAQAAAGAA
jgi:uncharacterized protein (DUF2235 family)